MNLVGSDGRKESVSDAFRGWRRRRGKGGKEEKEVGSGEIVFIGLVMVVVAGAVL